MKLQITKDLLNNDYMASFKIIDISNVDEELFKDFGKIRVNVGGNIPTLDGTSTFKLSNDERVIPDTFEFTKIFKATEYEALAEDYALAYIKEIETRVKTVISELEAKVDDFSGVEEIQL